MYLEAGSLIIYPDPRYLINQKIIYLRYLNCHKLPKAYLCTFTAHEEYILLHFLENRIFYFKTQLCSLYIRIENDKRQSRKPRTDVSEKCQLAYHLDAMMTMTPHVRLVAFVSAFAAPDVVSSFSSTTSIFSDTIGCLAGSLASLIGEIVSELEPVIKERMNDHKPKTTLENRTKTVEYRPASKGFELKVFNGSAKNSLT